jgi:hypothetical protein
MNEGFLHPVKLLWLIMGNPRFVPLYAKTKDQLIERLTQAGPSTFRAMCFMVWRHIPR